MPVVRGSGFPNEGGRRDALHHRDRLRRQIHKHLTDNIGEEDIIEAGHSKRIRVPVRSTRRYQFIHDRELSGGVGQGDGEPGDQLGPPMEGEKPSEAGTNPGEEMVDIWLDMEEIEELLFSSLELPRLKPKKLMDVETTDIRFDDIARKGPQLDKRATLRKNLERNASKGEAGIGGIDKEDLRYLSYRDLPKPQSRAVVFCLMDVSASMDAHHKQIARLFFYWTVQFLRHKYHQVEVVFIAHHSTARECSEHEFFNSKESGGTKVSSAYTLAQQLQRQRYPEADYNIYLLHASDGDNIASDNPQVVALIKEFLPFASLVAYLEIRKQSVQAMMSGTSQGNLSKLFEKSASDLDGFMWTDAEDAKEIWPALKKFFARDDVLEAVQ